MELSKYTKTIVSVVASTVITIACALTGGGINEAEWVYIFAAWSGSGAVFTFKNRPDPNPPIQPGPPKPPPAKKATKARKAATKRAG